MLLDHLVKYKPTAQHFLLHFNVEMVLIIFLQTKPAQTHTYGKYLSSIDTVLLGENANNLQNLVTMLKERSEEVGLKLNIKKTKMMVMTKEAGSRKGRNKNRRKNNRS